MHGTSIALIGNSLAVLDFNKLEIRLNYAMPKCDAKSKTSEQRENRKEIRTVGSLTSIILLQSAGSVKRYKLEIMKILLFE